MFAVYHLTSTVPTFEINNSSVPHFAISKDIIKHIFSFLEPKHHSVCKSVCKEWKWIINVNFPEHVKMQFCNLLRNKIKFDSAKTNQNNNQNSLNRPNKIQKISTSASIIPQNNDSCLLTMIKLIAPSSFENALKYVALIQHSENSYRARAELVSYANNHHEIICLLNELPPTNSEIRTEFSRKFLGKVFTLVEFECALDYLGQLKYLFSNILHLFAYNFVIAYPEKTKECIEKLNSLSFSAKDLDIQKFEELLSQFPVKNIIPLLRLNFYDHIHFKIFDAVANKISFCEDALNLLELAKIKLFTPSYPHNYDEFLRTHHKVIFHPLLLQDLFIYIDYIFDNLDRFNKEFIDSFNITLINKITSTEDFNNIIQKICEKNPQGSKRYKSFIEDFVLKIQGSDFLKKDLIKGILKSINDNKLNNTPLKKTYLTIFELCEKGVEKLAILRELMKMEVFRTAYYQQLLKIEEIILIAESEVIPIEFNKIFEILEANEISIYSKFEQFEYFINIFVKSGNEDDLNSFYNFFIKSFDSTWKSEVDELLAKTLNNFIDKYANRSLNLIKKFIQGPAACYTLLRAAEKIKELKGNKEDYLKFVCDARTLAFSLPPEKISDKFDILKLCISIQFDME